MADYTIKISATNYAAAVSFESFYDLYYKKELNKISEFRVTVYDLTGAQKSLAIEGSILYLFYGTDLVLKGEIRNVDKDDANDIYGIEGNGQEIKLHDTAVRGRTQWDDTAADDIIKSLISGIMAEGTISAALKVGFRAEEDSVLRAVMSVAQAIGWDWYVDCDETYDSDRLNFVASKGSASPTQTFSATTDLLEITKHDDVDNVYNIIRVFGYGDGLNQLMSESFAATVNRVTLSAEISAAAVSLTVNEDISAFSDTGNLRCGREYITYGAKNNETKTFTSLTRGVIPGTNPPTDNPYYISAYDHKLGAELIDLQYSDGGFPTVATAQSDSSLKIYGIKENIYVDQSIMHQTTVDLLALRLVNKYETPITRVEMVIPEESITAVTGDVVKVIFYDLLYPSPKLYPSSSLYPGNASATYRLIAAEFDDAEFTMRLTLGNAADDFLRDVSELQKNLDIASMYGLGNTIPIFVQSYENCDPTHPLHLRFFLPPELKAINHTYLNFKIEQYRAYTKVTQTGSAHTHQITGKTSGYSGSHSHGFGSGETTQAQDDEWYSYGYLVGSSTIKDLVEYSHTHTVDEAPGESDTPSGGLIDGARVITAMGPYGQYSLMSHSHKLQGATTQTETSHSHTISGIATDSESAHTHEMTYEIKEATETSPSITVKVGEDGGSLTEISGSPFTTDQTKRDITDLVRAVGVDKWIDIEFTPNQIRRIEANLYGQGFIESK